MAKAGYFDDLIQGSGKPKAVPGTGGYFDDLIEERSAYSGGSVAGPEISGVGFGSQDNLSPKLQAAIEAQRAPYKFGGNDPQSGLDCSSATCFVAKQFGVRLPRTAVGQFKDPRGKAVDGGALQPGDLVFFDTGVNRRGDNKLADGRHVTHVGVYVGGGKFAHQSGDKKPGMTTVSLSPKWQKQMVGARRFDGMALPVLSGTQGGQPAKKEKAGPPMPPLMQAYYSGKGRAVTPDETRAYDERAAEAALAGLVPLAELNPAQRKLYAQFQRQRNAMRDRQKGESGFGVDKLLAANAILEAADMQSLFRRPQREWPKKVLDAYLTVTNASPEQLEEARRKGVRPFGVTAQPYLNPATGYQLREVKSEQSGHTTSSIFRDRVNALFESASWEYTGNPVIDTVLNLPGGMFWGTLASPANIAAEAATMVDPDESNDVRAGAFVNLLTQGVMAVAGGTVAGQIVKGKPPKTLVDAGAAARRFAAAGNETRFRSDLASAGLKPKEVARAVKFAKALREQQVKGAVSSMETAPVPGAMVGGLRRRDVRPVAAEPKPGSVPGVGESYFADLVPGSNPGAKDVAPGVAKRARLFSSNVAGRFAKVQGVTDAQVAAMKVPLYQMALRAIEAGEDLDALGVEVVKRFNPKITDHPPSKAAIDAGAAPPSEGLFGAPLFQRGEPGPVWHSKLEMALAKVPDNATPDQVMRTLDGAGVKPEEIEYAGLPKWLMGQAKVDKGELEQFVRANRVRVEEVGLHGSVSKDEAVAAARRGENVWFALVDHRDPLDLSEVERAAAGDRFRIGGKATKYGQYTLPGGSDYRELLLTLPKGEWDDALEAKMLANRRRRQELISSDRPLHEVQYEIERLSKEHDEMRKQQSANEGYSSPHWPEKNVLAHVRFDTRNVGGKKVLHIAEIQSDWHQQGRKQGYRSARDYDGELAAVYKEAEPFTLQGQDAPRELLERAAAIQDARLKDSIGVPDAPFKKTWHELALRRMIKYAADNDFDAISWDVGATHAGRYDLSKQVDSIDIVRNPSSGLYNIVAKRDGKTVLHESYIPPEKVESYVGKEIAEKALKGQEEFVGPDLKVGGEGMVGFYDSMLPAAANKIGKRYGRKVERGSIPAGRKSGASEKYFASGDDAGGWTVYTRDGHEEVQGGFPTLRKADQWIDAQEGAAESAGVHFFEIPEGLRSDARERGMPLFQAPETAEFKRWFGKSKVVDENGAPKVMYHGTVNAGFDRFRALGTADDGNLRLLGKGLYFTDSPRIASEYAEPSRFELSRPITEKDVAALRRWLLSKEAQRDLQSDVGIRESYREMAVRLEGDNVVQGLQELFEQGRGASMALERLGITREGAAGSGIYPVYLRVEKPFEFQRAVTSDEYARIAHKFGIEANSRYVTGQMRTGEDVWQRAVDAVRRRLEMEGGDVRLAPDVVNDGLKELGYDGISAKGGARYAAGAGSDNVVLVFDATQVKSATGNSGAFDPNNPNLIQQQGAKGAYNPAAKVMTFVQGKSDVSTLIHETAHWFEQAIHGHEKYGKILRKHYGEFDTTTTRGVAGRERFARHLEMYFRSGEAPTPELRTVFAAIKQWMTQIYERLKYGKASDEVKAFFDETFGHLDDEVRALVREFDDLRTKDVGMDGPPRALIGDFSNKGDEVEPAANPPAKPKGGAAKQWKEPPEPGVIQESRGRQVAWNGAAREFVDDRAAWEYDQIMEPARKREREIRKAIEASTSPDERADLMHQLAIEQYNTAEAKRSFWDWHDKRSRGDLPEQRLERGADADLDAEFGRVIGDDGAANDAMSRARRRLDQGTTSLPFGDLKELGRDLAALAARAARKGLSFGHWAREMVASIGDGVRRYLRAAWASARSWLETPAKSPYPGHRKRGAAMPTGPKHLETGAPPEPLKRGFWRSAKYWLFTTDEVAGAARKQLERLLGTDLELSAVDIENAINQMSRLGHKIEHAVYNGFHDADGNKLSMGLVEIKEGMAKDGLDFAAWEQYRRALRENELFARGSAKIDKDRAAANRAFVQDYLDSVDREVLAKYDAAWQRFVDEQLNLYEQYGLRDAQWLEDTRAENAFYYPMHKVGTPEEMLMRAENPSRLASPMGQVVRAAGGETYMDGFAAMAIGTESLIREGSKNKLMLPFLKAAADLPGMEKWVKKVAAIEDVDEHGNLFSKMPDLEEGKDAVVTFYDNGEKVTYRIDPYLYTAIRGSLPQEFNRWARLAQSFASLNRHGTTKSNPLFGVIFNPLIDISSAMVNHGLGPFDLFRGWNEARKGVKSKAYLRAVESDAFFNSRGARDFIEQEWMFRDDSSAVRKIADAAAEARGIKVVADWGKAALGGLNRVTQVQEEATRMAMFLKMERHYLKRGLSAEEVRSRAAAESGRLMNFGEAGAIGRGLSAMGTPYANVTPQVLMQTWRGFKRNPAKWSARAFSLLTVPALVEYWMYKDDPEYQSFPNYVKDGTMLWKAPNGKWFALRIPHELGMLFKGVPRRILESLPKDKLKVFGKDMGLERDAGDLVREQLGSAGDALSPSVVPTWAALAGQQLFFQESGGVIDARFWTLRGWPQKDEDGSPKMHTYKQFVQQVDTAFGSLGRLGARSLGYLLGEEKSFPNPLQRYAPEPRMPKFEVRDSDGNVIDTSGPKPEPMPKFASDARDAWVQEFVSKAFRDWEKDAGDVSMDEKRQALKDMRSMALESFRAAWQGVRDEFKESDREAELMRRVGEMRKEAGVGGR